MLQSPKVKISSRETGDVKVLQAYYAGIADEDKVEIEMSGHSAK
ncbi:MAG: hypothetical protein V3V19_00505 [Cocleimonas sp.]